ncbi:MAG: LacI family transcriptional regulator [Defluviitaleaceae bacterium]|nr:LacI family transcriptional regulator [Defluviitaleaceae bacterium]
MKKKQLTSSQIAALAGVSRSTVSRVINNYPNVPEATFNHVSNIIKENNYYPHLSGQMLAGKKSSTIGLFWVKASLPATETTHHNANISQDLLSTSYLVHVIEAAANQNYLTLTCILDDLTSANNTEHVSKMFQQGRIDAGIFIGVNNQEPLIEELITQGFVCGIFNHYIPNCSQPNRITVNYELDIGEKIISYLYDLGHRDIALIHGNPNRFASDNREKSFLAALHKYNLPIKPEWQVRGDIYQSTGYSAAKLMLTNLIDNNLKLPTAICANNDAVAFGTYQALNELNIKIPQQISVTGIDGHSLPVSPSLTTYAFDYFAIFNFLVERTVLAATSGAAGEWYRKDHFANTDNTYPTNLFANGTLAIGCSCAKPATSGNKIAPS